MTIMIILTEPATKALVRGGTNKEGEYYLATAPGHALHPRPLKDGTYVLPPEVLADPVHAEVHDDLAAMPTRDVTQDEYLHQPISPLAPVNTKLPELTYTTAWPGLAVSCVPGEWSESPTYKFRWQADGVDLIQAVTSVHTVTVADVGKVLTCIVTGTNAYGSASAVSNECSVVALKTSGARKAAPAAASKPAVKKTAKKAPRNRAEIARKPANTRKKPMVAKKKKKPVLFTKEAASKAVKKIAPQRRKKK